MKRICIPENTICFQDNTKKVTKKGQNAECLDVQIPIGESANWENIFVGGFANCNWENTFVCFFLLQILTPWIFRICVKSNTGWYFIRTFFPASSQKGLSLIVLRSTSHCNPSLFPSSRPLHPQLGETGLVLSPIALPILLAQPFHSSSLDLCWWNGPCILYTIEISFAKMHFKFKIYKIR